MSISGVGAGYSEWREIRKTQKNNSGTGFVGRMADMDTTESSSSQRTSVRISACLTMTMQIIRTTGAFCFREIPIRQFSNGCRTTGEALRKHLRI